MALWVEDLTEDSFKICLREVKIFDGLHKGITIVSKVKILFKRPVSNCKATHIVYKVTTIVRKMHSRTNHTFLVSESVISA